MYDCWSQLSRAMRVLLTEAPSLRFGTGLRVRGGVQSPDRNVSCPLLTNLTPQFALYLSARSSLHFTLHHRHHEARLHHYRARLVRC